MNMGSNGGTIPADAQRSPEAGKRSLSTTGKLAALAFWMVTGGFMALAGSVIAVIAYREGNSWAFSGAAGVVVLAILAIGRCVLVLFVSKPTRDQGSIRQARWIIPSRGAWLGLGTIVALIFGIPIFYLWKSSSAQVASDAFEKRISAGMSISQVETYAKEFKADRFRVVEATGAPEGMNPRAIALWWVNYPNSRVCTIALESGKAKSIECRTEH